MSNLFLWRHAEAEDCLELSYESDLQRPLTKKGQKQAKLIAEWLASNLPVDSIIYASPAVRCQQTVAELIKINKFKPVSTTNKIAPGSSVSALLKCAGWEDIAFVAKSAELSNKQIDLPLDNILLVSHQPTLGMLVSRLVSGVNQNFALKKGAVCWLEYRKRDEKPEIISRSLINPSDLEK